MVDNKLETPHVRQSALANSYDISTRSRPLQYSSTLQFGYVVSVDHVNHTCSVNVAQGGNSNIRTSESDATTVALPVTNYGINKYGESYGTFPMVAQGSRVLIGYVDQNMATPVVLNVYPPDNVDIMADISPSATAYGDDTTNNQDEFWSNKTVYPNQQVSMNTGSGEFIHTYNGYSFIGTFNNLSDVLDENDEARPDYYNNDYNGRMDDFTGAGYWLDAFRNFNTGEEYQLPTQAQDWVLVHQSDTDIDNHLTKFMIKSNGIFEGTFNDKDDATNIMQLTSGIDDGFKLIRQYDTKDTQTGVSSVYSLFQLNNENEILLTVQDEDSMGSILVTSKGTYIDGVLIASQESVKQVGQSLQNLKDTFDPIYDKVQEVGLDFFPKTKSDILSLQNNLQDTDKTATSANSLANSNKNSIGILQGSVENNQKALEGVNKQVTSIIGDNGTGLSLTSINSSVVNLQNNIKNYVTVDTNQTIQGLKDFSKTPTSNGSIIGSSSGWEKNINFGKNVTKVNSQYMRVDTVGGKNVVYINGNVDINVSALEQGGIGSTDKDLLTLPNNLTAPTIYLDGYAPGTPDNPYTFKTINNAVQYVGIKSSFSSLNKNGTHNIEFSFAISTF